MSPLGIGLILAYVTLAAAGLVKTRLLEAMVVRPFREVLPLMLRGFWDVYPGRFWPGPLKILGYPMTVVFLLVVACLFTVFHAVLVVAISPKLVWWLFERRPPVTGAPA